MSAKSRAGELSKIREWKEQHFGDNRASKLAKRQRTNCDDAYGEAKVDFIDFSTEIDELKTFRDIECLLLEQ